MCQTYTETSGSSDAKQLIFGNEKSTNYTQNNNTKAVDCFFTTHFVLTALITAMAINHFNCISKQMHAKKCIMSTKQCT